MLVTGIHAALRLVKLVDPQLRRLPSTSHNRPAGRVPLTLPTVMRQEGDLRHKFGLQEGQYASGIITWASTPPRLVEAASASTWFATYDVDLILTDDLNLLGHFLWHWAKGLGLGVVGSRLGRIKSTQADLAKLIGFPKSVNRRSSLGKSDTLRVRGRVSFQNDLLSKGRCVLGHF